MLTTVNLEFEYIEKLSLLCYILCCDDSASAPLYLHAAYPTHYCTRFTRSLGLSRLCALCENRLRLSSKRAVTTPWDDPASDCRRTKMLNSSVQLQDSLKPDNLLT